MSNLRPAKAGLRAPVNFRSAAFQAAARPQPGGLGKSFLYPLSSEPLRPGRPRSEKTRLTFPARGARPVPGRSSRESVEALEYLEDAHHHRTRCAPGHRAVRFGWQLCRARQWESENRSSVIGHRKSMISQISDSRFAMPDFTISRPERDRSPVAAAAKAWRPWNTSKTPTTIGPAARRDVARSGTLVRTTARRSPDQDEYASMPTHEQTRLRSP